MTSTATQPQVTNHTSLKWPSHLFLVRHAQSRFNGQKNLKAQDPTYQRFKKLYDALPPDKNPTKEMQALATAIAERWSLNTGDHDTELTEEGIEIAGITGLALQQSIDLPDVVIVSPYLRAYKTFDAICAGWPALAKVEFFEEERIREQEHGLALLYNDWRVFFTLHPQQRRLYHLEGRYYYRYPQGENVPDVRERNRSWINTLVREFAGKKVFVVTHHLTILATRANFERLNATQFIALDDKDKPANCSLTTYTGQPNAGRRGQGKMKLQYYNQVFYQRA